MGWLMSFVALSLTMAVLTITALGRPIKARAVTLPALSAGDRLISLFVVSTFTVASLYGLTLLAAKVLP